MAENMEFCLSLCIWMLCLEDLAYPNGIMIQYLQLVYNLGSYHMGMVIFRKGFIYFGNGAKSAKWSHCVPSL